MSQSRQLAAIMFTDMVGYTALMQKDEEEAKKKRKRHKFVFNSFVEKHHGKVLQYFGDGTLSIFSSAINSVNCAIDIQQELNQAPKVDIRIGIHTGDISYDIEGIYGNGVNIASRIETLAVPGSIFVSDRVYEDVRNQKHIKIKEIGFFEMKNVNTPVHVYAIANEGLVIPGRDIIEGKTKQPLNTLAVLPFINLSNDPDNEYFSDGITEELLNALTAVDGLRVTSRTSSFAMKGRNEDIRDIASKLNVEKLVEGSVRKSGNRVRITAQLINAIDGFHIWSETYDRDLNDIFQVQDEISKNIANKLRAKLSPFQKEEILVKPPVKNLEAYSLFLKGKYHQNKEVPEEMFKAIELYKQAIAIEPEFASAYAQIAGVYAMLGSVGVVQREKAFQEIKFNSSKALQIDNTVAGGYVGKAVGYLIFEWNWDAAFQSVMKAIELNPGMSEAYMVLGYYYLVLNNPSDAVNAFEKAWQQDPLSMTLARSLSIAYFYKERYDDTIRLSEMQLDVFPGNWYALSLKGFAVGMKDNWKSALEIFIEANKLSAGSPLTLSYIAYTYGKLSKKDDALLYVEQIKKYHESHPDFFNNENLLLCWSGIGDYDKAFFHLFNAIENKEGVISFMINSPIHKGLHNDARFKEARKKMNL